MTFENDLFELVNGHPILQYSIARTWGEMHRIGRPRMHQSWKYHAPQG